MIEQRVVEIEEALRIWFDSNELLEAIEKTVEANLFNRHDVNFAVEHLKKTVERGDILYWVDLYSELSSPDDTRTILCLHAGNLPLVGFQDMLAVVLSGARYAGKISKKDPFLITSFILLLKQLNPVLGEKLGFSTELSDFAGLKADLWMFAGSEVSLDEIKSALEKQHIVKSDSESLLRVAHFSMAVINSHITTSCLVDLVESILRYNGKGCRSVAIICSDMELSDLAEELELIGREWLIKNRIHFNPDTLLKWRHAYNSAVNIDQVWLGNALVQVGHPVIGHNQHVYWQPMKSLQDLLSLYGSGVQQVYTSQKGDLTEFELFSDKKDYLGNSQTPELYWKPDGIDPLKWILTR